MADETPPSRNGADRAIIEARGVSKTYPTQGGKRALLGRGGIGRLFGAAQSPRQALAPVTLEILRGETVGIIGRNGSGKSTLLKLIAGVTAPTTGAIHIHGRVASLLELGAGFHPMLTGRENVYLYAGLLGMRHAQVDACFDAIEDFAELADYIDQTVDTYSSGMYVRLAFAVAVYTDPDIFLVDEVLSVGDEAFQRKCRNRILELSDAGKTILFVSHDLGTVQTLCDRVILLDNGKLLSRGSTRDTIDYYLRMAGEEGGVHRMHQGDTEAVFNQGRIALFHRERELTAPLGLKVQFYSLDTYHESTNATWTITESTEQAMEAKGTFSRLPIRLYLSCRIRDGALAVSVSWENLQPLDISYVALQCFVRTTFTRWQSGAAYGALPPITPEHHQWAPIATVRHGLGACELYCEGSGQSPLCFALEDDAGRGRFELSNTDYLTQARIVHLTEAIPSGETPLPPGERTLGTLLVDPTADESALEVRHARARARRETAVPPVHCALHDGFMAINYQEIPVTGGAHCHFQFRVGDIWLMSHSLLWDEPEIADEARVATGTSQRLPCTATWNVTADGTGIDIELLVRADDDFELAEYNVSLGLAPGFNVWKTPTEAGRFDETPRSEANWTHLNRDFTTGNAIQAQGLGLPIVALNVEQALGDVIPTAIRTGDNDQGVLQLLVNPGRANAFTLRRGTHSLFRGRVALVPEGAA